MAAIIPVKIEPSTASGQIGLEVASGFPDG